MPLETHPQNHVFEILYLYLHQLFFVVLIFRLIVVNRLEIYAIRFEYLPVAAHPNQPLLTTDFALLIWHLL